MGESYQDLPENEQFRIRKVPGNNKCFFDRKSLVRAIKTYLRMNSSEKFQEIINVF
jgi:hypothetical protein